MGADEIILKLSEEEALFLAAILGNDEFIGIDSPLFSMSEQEAKLKWNSLQVDLEEKQYIEVGFDGSVVVDEVVYGVINTCCRCDMYILLSTLSKGATFSEYHYYITEYLAVEMTKDPGGNSQYLFRLIPDIAGLKSSINNKVILEKPGAPNIENMRVPEKLLEECKKKIDGGNKQDAVSLLVSNGTAETAASEVVALMDMPYDYVSVALVNFGEANSGSADKLVLLQNEKNTIKLDTVNIGGESYFDFVPVTYKEALNSVLEITAAVDTIYKYGKEVASA